ncbi:UNKNOWN [Stylonychia lemnae]|uniref:Uncharacterized protein n=1 Tax=Stylonychia lemnae TaxID=5949 RepID=A0A078B8E0_STYLE|nr:UNKNOWN [Stylonychia lemnae]|eukprot:CDW90461.1 UNKNOWN [Stylonychia lemnae]
MIQLTDLNGISIGKSSEDISQFNFTRILTNPSSGFTFLLPQNLSDGQYLISIVSRDFPPEQRVIQVKRYYDYLIPKYEVKLVVLNEKVELNQTILGKVEIVNNTQINGITVPIPSSYSTYNLSISYKYQNKQESFNLTLDQMDFVYFSINPQIYIEQGNICILQLQATIKIENTNYQSNELQYQFGDTDYYFYKNIKAIFQNMQLSDPVMNDYLRIYYYFYMDQNQTRNVIDVPFNFKQVRFGAYINDTKKPDVSVRYITANGILFDNGSHFFDLPQFDKEIYFLEIITEIKDSNFPTSQPFNEDEYQQFLMEYNLQENNTRILWIYLNLIIPLIL